MVFVSRSVSVDMGASIPVSISIFVYVSGCGGRRMLRMRVVQEMNLRTWVGNLIPPTDRPTARVPWADHRGRAWTHPHARPRWPVQGTRVLDGEADWSTSPVKSNFDEFHNQRLTHWHYQIADLFNRQNITSINCPKLHFASSVLWFYGLEIFVVEFVL